MKIKAYLLLGPIGSGKSALINQLNDSESFRSLNALCLQFEMGNTSVQLPHILFSKKQVDHHLESVVHAVAEKLTSTEVDVVYIEWNMNTSLIKLQEILQHPMLSDKVEVHKAIFLSSTQTELNAHITEHILNANYFYSFEDTTSVSKSRLGDFRSTLKTINPDIKLIHHTDVDAFSSMLVQDKKLSGELWIGGLLALVTLLFFTSEWITTFANKHILFFLGVFLQAIPFLAIGVMLSSAIQIFITHEWIESKFPKSVIKGTFIAIIGGFLLPVCDCASIPVFRSLVRKGVPLPAAITFLLASPVINPVVILSTYYAFNGKWSIVFTRVILGILVAVLTSFAYVLYPPKQDLLLKKVSLNASCDCCNLDVSESSKWEKWLMHAMHEFLDVGRYLIFGIAVTTLVSMTLPSLQGGNSVGFLESFNIFGGMALAFLLSLCSSSDAMVAQSFLNKVSMSAIYAFLVFGPMIDLKNILLLKSGFSLKFILRLTFTVMTFVFILLWVLPFVQEAI